MARKKIVIVGSGLGGLLCAGLLSKNGYEVEVLEQHHQIGGNLQTFFRGGLEFDTGMHYFGCMAPGQVMYQVLKYLGIMDRLHLAPLDSAGFDRIHIGSEIYPYAMGYEGFQKSLSAQFPNDVAAIERYVELLKNNWDHNPMLNLRELSREASTSHGEFGLLASKVVEDLTQNKRLQAVLLATNGLYAGHREKTPFYVHATIQSFFIQSAWRFESGGRQLPQLLQERITQQGGTIRTRAKVVEFIHENSEVSAVLLENGERVVASAFISNLHPMTTHQLCKEKAYRRIAAERLSHLENSCSSLTVHIVLHPRALIHDNCNHYLHSDDRVWTMGDEADKRPWPTGMMMYTTKSQLHTGYAESVTLISALDFSEVEIWEHTKLGQRPAEYKAFKQKNAELLLNLGQRVIPNLSELIKSMAIATPLTYRDYTNTPRGSMYGIVKDAHRPLETFLSPTTRLNNLLLTGQNINLHGMLGVTMTALVTCAYHTDINAMIRAIREA